MTQVRREPVGMASGSGPRAKGTDGADHKFRQRVDDHYKLMADGRAKLASSGRAHAAGACGLLGALGAAALGPGEGTPSLLLLLLGA
eukprot:CAMPEP_0196710620 /NCGR_PEP_ID=MMETSP1090-20130531/70583_1 /TAXON_ID=37098 /ORGANISM="Isochrysis sp, Strain CCMP1244" /LENGTH=86 /DNA_ID=CAMNT_0042050653 /DNA_START=119 /DNA_END=376 /DNA_ORIENTATION=-